MSTQVTNDNGTAMTSTRRSSSPVETQATIQLPHPDDFEMSSFDSTEISANITQTPTQVSITDRNDSKVEVTALQSDGTSENQSQACSTGTRNSRKRDHEDEHYDTSTNSQPKVAKTETSLSQTSTTQYFARGATQDFDSIPGLSTDDSVSGSPQDSTTANHVDHIQPDLKPSSTYTPERLWLSQALANVPLRDGLTKIDPARPFVRKPRETGRYSLHKFVADKTIATKLWFMVYEWERPQDQMTDTQETEANRSSKISEEEEEYNDTVSVLDLEDEQEEIDRVCAAYCEASESTKDPEIGTTRASRIITTEHGARILGQKETEPDEFDDSEDLDNLLMQQTSEVEAKVEPQETRPFTVTRSNAGRFWPIGLTQWIESWRADDC